jgi:DNA-binding NarL/FixJ family response regulator
LLLVDQNDDFLDGMSALLERDLSFEIVGRAHTAREAVERCRTLRPDVVLLDVSLPDQNGFQVAPWLKALKPAPRVLMMSFHPSRVAELAAITVGADACISKAEVPDQLLPVLRDLLWPESPLALATRTG